MTAARSSGNLTVIILLLVIFTLRASKGVPNATLSWRMHGWPARRRRKLTITDNHAGLAGRRLRLVLAGGRSRAPSRRHVLVAGATGDGGTVAVTAGQGWLGTGRGHPHGRPVLQTQSTC